MAEAAAAEEKPTHAQMIAEMQKAKFTPTETSQPEPTDPTHDQMIAEMKAAGFVPPTQSEEGESFGKLDSNGNISGMQHGPQTSARTLTGLLPLAGNVIGGLGGAAAGTAVAPGVGTMAVETLGAGAGAAAGSTAKDMLNNWIYGENKSAGDIAADAGKTGAIAAGSQLAGGLLLKGAGMAAGALAEKVIPRAVITRYQQAADAVKELIGNSGGDTAEAAQQTRNAMSGSLDEFRGNLNNQIATALEGSTERVNPKQVIDTLESMKGRVHGDLPSAAAYHGQIDSYIASLNKMRDENGMVFVSDMNSLKRDLQNVATAAYRGGTDGMQFADAAQKAAASARGLINKAVPELASANDKLAALHVVEDGMNKSIFKEGASAAGMIGAGEAKTEAGKASAKALRTLSEITGQDFIGKAQDVAAVKAFGADSLLKRGAGAAGGAAIGAGAAELTGNDPYHGAMVGGALGGAVTSPFAVKTAIDLGRYIPAQLATPAAQALGQSVMHGFGASSALKQVGGTP